MILLVVRKLASDDFYESAFIVIRATVGNATGIFTAPAG